MHLFSIQTLPRKVEAKPEHTGLRQLCSSNQLYIHAVELNLECDADMWGLSQCINSKLYWDWD